MKQPVTIPSSNNWLTRFSMLQRELSHQACGREMTQFWVAQNGKIVDGLNSPCPTNFRRKNPLINFLDGVECEQNRIEGEPFQSNVEQNIVKYMNQRYPRNCFKSVTVLQTIPLFIQVVTGRKYIQNSLHSQKFHQ